MAGISRYNASGAYDPTAHVALTRVSKSEKAAKRKPPLPKVPTPQTQPSKPRQLVYIASPYRGNVALNKMNAKRYCAYAVEKGKFPIAPHIWMPQFLDDDIPAERSLAINAGLYFLAQCSEVWVFGNIATEGMQGEILAAQKLGKTIRYFADYNMEIYETRRKPEC
jgi:hypothetical protein